LKSKCVCFLPIKTCSVRRHFTKTRLESVALMDPSSINYACVLAGDWPPLSTHACTHPVEPAHYPAGYGPKPVGVDETEPEVGFVRDDVYAAEAIVDERQRSGHREFRLRWKGYGPESDTWEPESHLIVGATQLLYAWKHQRHH
jgi:hypothetical protein